MALDELGEETGARLPPHPPGSGVLNELTHKRGYKYARPLTIPTSWGALNKFRASPVKKPVNELNKESGGDTATAPSGYEPENRHRTEQGKCIRLWNGGYINVTRAAVEGGNQPRVETGDVDRIESA